MFVGNYEISIDEKGRVLIPKEFEEELGKETYIVKKDGYLEIYPKKTWEEKYTFLGKDGNYDQETLRYIFATSFKKKIDKQRRINLNSYFPKGKVVISGFNEKIEVRTKEDFEKLLKIKD